MRLVPSLLILGTIVAIKLGDSFGSALLEREYLLLGSFLLRSVLHLLMQSPGVVIIVEDPFATERSLVEPGAAVGIYFAAHAADQVRFLYCQVAGFLDACYY